MPQYPHKFSAVIITSSHAMLLLLLFTTLSIDGVRIYSNKTIPIQPMGRFATRANSDISPKIIGGNDATLGEFNFNVLIYALFPNDITKGCVGAIIHPKAVITSADCLHYGEVVAESTLIVAGRVNREGDPNEQRRVYKYLHFHDNYKRKPNVRFTPFDIAIISINDEFVFNRNIDKIAIAGMASQPPVKGIVTGWGVTTSKTTGEPKPAPVLQKMKTTYINNDQCDNMYGNGTKVPDEFLCAYSIGASICNGDEGATLVDEGKTSVHGVASTYHSECDVEYPQFFTRVEPYVDWITRVLGSIDGDDYNYYY